MLLCVIHIVYAIEPSHTLQELDCECNSPVGSCVAIELCNDFVALRSNICQNSLGFSHFLQATNQLNICFALVLLAHCFMCQHKASLRICENKKATIFHSVKIVTETSGYTETVDNA